MGNRKAREWSLRVAEEADWERVLTEPRPPRANLHALGIGIRRFQLIVTPSFDEASVWEVRQGPEWQLIHPRVIKTKPDLLVVGHEIVPFQSTTLAEYFKQVTCLTLPLRPDFSGAAVADGTFYEFSVYGDLGSEWRFRWLSDWTHEHWRPLIELATEIHAAFTKACNQ